MLFAEQEVEDDAYDDRRAAEQVWAVHPAGRDRAAADVRGGDAAPPDTQPGAPGEVLPDLGVPAAAVLRILGE